MTIADEIATGSSYISAKINGIPRKFEVTVASEEFGVHAEGYSGDDKINFHIQTYIGRYMWYGRSSFMQYEPSALLNNADALKDIGFLNVTMNDVDCVYGTFEFKVLNPATKDTIYVTDGTFKIRYVNTAE